MEIRPIIEVYNRYGFVYERKYEQLGVLVFTLQNGYFDNADIVSLKETESTEQAFSEYTKSGFACTKRPFLSLDEIEQELFKGFFFVASTKERLAGDYLRFSRSITSPYSESATYRYIDAPYTINEKKGEKSLVSEIQSRLDSSKPILFLIEAAAGFGKTCTAYELVNSILSNTNKLPLFSELSRNRSAKIFRYVLLDEIDRTFPQLKSKLVESEITNGKVVAVLDGFDELLRKSDASGEFENSEPMLETIGELMRGKAKVILTTRRTVIFEGDDFHQWVERHSDDFDLIRLRLHEPRIVDWIDPHRLNKIKSASIDIESISNPVLLSYLRCISEADFDAAIWDNENLVDKYFTFMLERERTRQDLRLSPEGQSLILKDITRDMIDLGYTSESRDYIVDYINERHSKLLDEVRSSYASHEKPTRDEIANKLASHALLDRSSSDATKIGFINEFVFGNFIAENIISSSEWLNDDLRFLEPAVVSYVPRGVEQREKLWQKIQYALNYVDFGARINYSSRLIGKINFTLENGEAEAISLNSLTIGREKISSFQFNECVFHDCVFNLSNLCDVTFLTCKFYNCTIVGEAAAGAVHAMGCMGDQNVIDAFRQLASLQPGRAQNNIELERSAKIDRYILEKFWPIGSQNFHKRRPVKSICKKNNEYFPEELYDGISALKKRGLLLDPFKPSFVEINIEYLSEVKSILGRGL
ncbi:NACHT domain-containing protein [Pseudomonas syringae]|uniref:NACHT domain-containing protein n=1 Tax=Pseudomonas syringae TaxID=317 RepID=UPI003F85780C